MLPQPAVGAEGGDRGSFPRKKTPKNANRTRCVQKWLENIEKKRTTRRQWKRGTKGRRCRTHDQGRNSKNFLPSKMTASIKEEGKERLQKGALKKKGGGRPEPALATYF